MGGLNKIRTFDGLDGIVALKKFFVGHGSYADFDNVQTEAYL